VVDGKNFDFNHHLSLEYLALFLITYAMLVVMGWKLATTIFEKVNKFA
jgi:hypothetical protein